MNTLKTFQHFSVKDQRKIMNGRTVLEVWKWEVMREIEDLQEKIGKRQGRIEEKRTKEGSNKQNQDNLKWIMFGDQFLVSRVNPLDLETKFRNTDCANVIDGKRKSRQVRL